MKVVRLHGLGDVRLEEEETPRPAEGEVLLRVGAVGICGSDLLWLQQEGIGETQLAGPLILGHEFAGTDEDGRRVAVDPSISCGRCVHCREGNPNFCKTLRFAGHGREDGAMREFLAWPETCCFPLPPSIDCAGGAMLEPLGVALHSADLAHLEPGMRVGILGCGPIGLLILQLVRLSGADPVLAADVLAHRLDAARSFGAGEVLPAKAHTVLVPESARRCPTDLDVVFEAAGDNAAVETAVRLAKPGGKIILIGIPPDDRTAFNASQSRRKGLTLRIVRRMKHTYPRAIELLEKGLVDVSSLITHRFPLEQTAEAFAVASRREGIKVLVELS